MTNGIGVLREHSLHAALKRHLARPGDGIEMPVDGSVIDLVQDGTLVEIQTGHFGAIRAKLERLLDQHDVRLVYPLPIETWITRVDRHGEVLGRRRSPRRGVLAHVFLELVSIPAIVPSKRFTLEVIEVRVEEIRRDLPPRRRRARHHILDRKLLEVVGHRIFRGPADFRVFLEGVSDDAFTTAELAVALRQPRYLAQKAAYCLRSMGAIETVGKRGNAFLYRAA
jgi:hypothetical protein